MNPLRHLRARRAISASGVIHLPDRSTAAMGADGHCAQQAAIPAVRSLRKRIAVLLAVITVPAMATPGDFGALPGGAPTEAEMVNARLAAQIAENPPMDFERPGMSFPGSAFFFLADPPATGSLIALPTIDARDPGAEAGHKLGEMIDVGPAARPFFSSSGLAHDRALECLAQAVWYEAASESEAGQRAVAQVVLNRVAHPSWPSSVCGVVYEGSQRSTGCQFTFTCDGSLSRKARGASWDRARTIARDALSGSVYAPVGHATHYHTLWVNPYWASSLDHVGTIGAHRFYRNRGSGGEKSAFTSRYAGFEPGASERITAAARSQPALQYSPDLASAPMPGPVAAPKAPAGHAIEPILADPALSGVGQVREDFARAGQWKTDAARDALQADQRKLASEQAQDSAAARPQ